MDNNATLQLNKALTASIYSLVLLVITCFVGVVVTDSGNGLYLALFLLLLSVLTAAYSWGVLFRIKKEWKLLPTLKRSITMVLASIPLLLFISFIVFIIIAVNSIEC